MFLDFKKSLKGHIEGTWRHLNLHFILYNIIATKYGGADDTIGECAGSEKTLLKVLKGDIMMPAADFYSHKEKVCVCACVLTCAKTGDRRENSTKYYQLAEGI